MEFLLLLILFAAKGSPLGGFAKLLQNEPLRSLPVGNTTAGELANAAQKLGFLTGEKQPCGVLPAAGGDTGIPAAENKNAAFSAAENLDMAFSAAKNLDMAFSAAADGDTGISSGSSPWSALARLAAAKDAFAEFTFLLRALGAGAQSAPQAGAAGEIAETDPRCNAAGVRCAAAEQNGAAAEQNGGAAEPLSDTADSQNGAHPHGKAACNPFAPIAPFAPDEYVSALNRCFA